MATTWQPHQRALAPALTVEPSTNQQAVVVR
jgi:hypothetical protein